MRNFVKAISALGLIASTAITTNANAQARVRRLPRPGGSSSNSAALQKDDAIDLRGMFGIAKVTELLRSNDAEDRKRAIDRAASIGTPEAIALIAPTQDPLSIVKEDPRAWIDLARALSTLTSEEAARKALLAIVNGAPNRAVRARSSSQGQWQKFASTEDATSAARFAIARSTAALALASDDDPHTAELLFPVVRGNGAGQEAAATALLAYPPQQIVGLASNGMSPSLASFLAELGDLRTIDALRAAAHANETRVRAASIVAMARAGDSRVIEIAHAIADPDAKTRIAIAVAMMLVDAKDKASACEALIADDATMLAGALLASHVESEGIVKALAARAVSTSDADVRVAAIVALGRAESMDAVRAIAVLLQNEALRGDAADALARSPSVHAMRAIEDTADIVGMRRLMTRAYVVRKLVRGESSSRMDHTIKELGESDNVNDRALATFARVALGDDDGRDAFSNRDVEVRRAAVMGSLVARNARVDRALLHARAKETDDATRTLMSIGLFGGDDEGLVTTSELERAIKSGGSDAPLAAFALAAREGETRDERVDALLQSNDDRIRAHTARGLARSRARDASGRLASAYAYDPNVVARRAEIEALAARTQDEGAPIRSQTLAIAARLDADATVRFIASRALKHAAAPGAYASTTHEIAWLRATRADAGPPLDLVHGALFDASGWSVPIIFDADGYALVPGVDPGQARLLLAPALPTYNATPP